MWQWCHLSAENTDLYILCLENKGCVYCLELLHFCEENVICKNLFAFIAVSLKS